MNKSIIVAIIIAAIAVPVGVYATSPLFTNTMIDEPAPVADNMMEDTSMEEATTEDKEGDAMMEDKGEGMMTETELAGGFSGAGDGIHHAQGAVKVIYLEGESDVLRLENLRVTNGPDLYIYLSTDKQASDFVDLGRLKANSGNQNYDIPDGIDLSKYNTVLIWCKQFSVLFGSAELTSSMSA
jgi:hypothetical protein